MIAALISTVVPAAKAWIETNPITVIQLLAAVAVILRFVSHGKISLGWDNKDSGGSGTAGFALMLLCCTLVGLFGFTLTACSSLSGVDGSVYYIDSTSGAKGGLTFTDGKTKASFRLPIYNEHGKEVGRAVINGTK